MTNLTSKAFHTRAVHAGERAKPTNATPVATPIVPAVGYLYADMRELDAAFEGKRDGAIYLRYDSPTVNAFEQAVASLERAVAAQAFSSGMAAIHGALLAAGVRAGTTVVAALDVYGGTFALLNGLLTTLGVACRMVDVSDLHAVELALSETKAPVLFAETISNPLLKIADVPALSALAGKHGAALLVDNTFATPYLFNPLVHGAAYSIHSATKYIAGHDDVLAGVVAASAADREKLNSNNRLLGSVLGPFEAWLALRGIKTLPLRVERQFASAMQVASWLASRPEIAKVNYPGLGSHSQHALAEKLFGGRGFGGVLSFELKNADIAKAYRFMDALELWLTATTLGDVYSLAVHPASSSHRELTPEQRAQGGISDGLVRLSVGIEHVQDLLADLDAALGRSA